jgi:hypothetical protein
MTTFLTISIGVFVLNLLFLSAKAIRNDYRKAKIENKRLKSKL